MNATALQPFLTVALPIMFTILIAVWVNSHGINRGFDGMNAAINGVHKRLDAVGTCGKSLDVANSVSLYLP